MSANFAVASAPSRSHARRWPRYKLDVPIRVIASRPGKAVIVAGRGRDISEGGMMVFAGIELRVDDRADVEFTPPFGDPLRVTAIVRNRRGYYYGLEFLRDNADDLAKASKLGEILKSSSGMRPRHSA
jgi:hypothetical protein